MRNIRIKPVRVKPVSIQVHPNFFNKMEEMRKQFQRNNVSVSQMELTNMIASKVKIPKIDIMGVGNERKKR